MKSLFFLIYLFLLSSFFAFSQNNCATSYPFCTGTNYNFPALANGSTAQTGPDYGCLFSQPNPVWYYLQVANSGVITMTIGGASSADDIDFVCWGPFTSPTAPCASQLTSLCTPNCGNNTTVPAGSYPSGNMVDCSYDIQAVEACTIPNAVTGQFYLVLITNFAGTNTNIIFNQTNNGSPGAGSTNCAILCNITGMTATPGPCNPANNTLNLTGTITTYAAPTTGTLTLTSSCGGSTIINPPFSTSINYTVTNVPATGSPCTITGVYSADTSCHFTTNFVSPAPCSVVPPCAISNVTAIPTACSSLTNTYDVNGSATFINQPTTGTLTISSSCGGSFMLNAPFVSPISYTLTALPSNGSTCTVTAVFSATPTCINTTTFNAPPSCSCSATAANNGPICAGITLLLFSSPSGATSYSWTGPNGFVSNLQNPTIPNSTTLAAGIYTVSVTLPGGAGCLATTTVVINPSPAANAGLDATVCVGGTIQLNGSGGSSYAWLPITNLSNTAISNPIASPTVTTSYTVTVGNLGCSYTDTVTIFVVNTLNAVANANTIICNGETAAFLASGGTNYQWIPTIGLSASNIPNPICSATITTTYIVVVSAAGGCPNDTATTTITVNPPPNVIVSPNDTICPGQTGTVSASGATNYLWITSASTNDTLTASPNANTNYTVVGTTGNCVDSAMVSIIVIPLPIASFATLSQTELGNYSVCFTNTSSITIPSLWSLDTANSALLNPCYVFPDAGTYQVCLTVQNSIGCPSTYCEDILLKADWTIYIPNSFTPNDNELNDIFYVYGTNLLSFELYIFDRWGNNIYQTNDINEGWNGKVNNSGKEPVQIDTYVYRVRITDSDGKKHSYTGHLTVAK